MQVLHEKYGENGLTILAFPCNDFKHQEPGTNDEILSFARKKGASFPIFAKLDCEQGDESHPLYKFLKKAVVATDEKPIKLKWNFQKFLCDANGVPLRSFGPKESPLSFESEILQLINT